MRSVFAYGFFAFLLVAVGGISMMWFFQAYHGKNALQQAIAELNQPQTVISYEAIETSGFPNQVIISLVKPRFSGRIDQWLAQNPHMAPLGIAAGMPAWQLESQLQGRIDFSVNIFSSRYMLALRGDSETTSELDGERITMRSQSQGDTLCQLELKRDYAAFTQLWNFNPFPADAQALRDQFRLLDCAYPGGKTVSVKDGTWLSQSGPLRIYLSSQPQAEQLSARLYLTMVDSEISPAGDAVLRALHAAPMAAYGKQNLTLDMSYGGPKSWQGSSPSATPFNFTLSQLNVRNQLYQLTLSGLASNALAGTQRTSKLSFSSEANFTQAYDERMKESTQELIVQLYTHPAPELQPLQAQLATLDPGQLADALKPALPQLHSLGKINGIIDIEATTQQGSPQGSYALKNLQLAGTPYGIAAQGRAQMAGTPFPQGELGLSCRNCLQMVDDFGNYYQRVKMAALAMNTDWGSAFTQTPAMFDVYKQLLKDLGRADAAQPSTLLFQLASDGAGGISLNGKNAASVMEMYNQRMAPVLLGKP